MALTGVTLRRNAASDLPKEYLEKALKENPTAWGVSVVTPEGLMIAAGDGADIELIQNTVKEYPDRDITFFLCNSESAINMDEVMPMTLVEAKDQPHIVAFVTGDYTGFKKPGSALSSAYHFVEDYLKPKVAEIYEDFDGDIDKIFTKIEKPLFKKDLLMNASAAATVTILAYNGKAVSFAQGTEHSEYTWGWVSSNYGYAVAVPQHPKETVVQKVRSMLPAGKSTVREPAGAPKGSVVEPKATAGSEAVKNYSTRKEKPNPKTTRKDKKLFYQKRIGYFPVGWEDGIAVEVWVDAETNQMVPFHEIKSLGLQAVGVPILKNPPKAGNKDTETEHIPHTNDKPTGPAVTDAVLPVMSPKAREYAKDILKREDVKKMIAENGDVVEDPSKIKDEEVKIADFGTQLGMKGGIFSHVLLPFAEFKRWNRENPESFEVFAFNLRNMVCYNEAKANQKLSGSEKHQLAKEELAPTKSMLPRKASAA